MALVTKVINPLHGLLTFVTTRVVILENLFVDKFTPLDRLYATVSGGSSQPSAAMLALHLKKIGLRLSSLELNFRSNYSGGLGSIVALPPPSHSSTELV